jgi:hypothetical protein
MSKHFGDIELLDYSESRASTRFHFGAITALNIAGFLTQFGALRDAIDSITLGTISKERWIGDSTILSNIPPNDPNAQIELVWAVYWDITDGGSKRLRKMCFACPDSSKLIPGTDRADTTDTDIAAFITAFEALVIDPIDDEAPAVVSRIMLEGR